MPFAILAALCAGPALSQSISFIATDLADDTVGQDKWEYQYTVSGSFAAFQGFSVYFPSDKYASLQSPPPSVNANWDIRTFQPDGVANLPGFYDSFTATPQSPSPSDNFRLTFVWKGAGVPGIQSFDIYQDRPDTGFATLSSGSTIGLTPIPEPETWVFAAGLPLIAWAVLRRHLNLR